MHCLQNHYAAPGARLLCLEHYLQLGVHSVFVGIRPGCVCMGVEAVWECTMMHTHIHACAWWLTKREPIYHVPHPCQTQHLCEGRHNAPHDNVVCGLWLCVYPRWALIKVAWVCDAHLTVPPFAGTHIE